MLQRTLVLLKPDAVQRSLVGEILQRFERAGLRISQMRMVFASSNLAERHYHDLADRLTEHIGREKAEAMKQLMVEFLSSSPIVALCLEGIEAIEVVRKIIGPTDPKKARPGTIRGDYAHMSLAHAQKAYIALPNLAHASDSEESAERELNLWFPEIDLRLD